jgi:signal transduction histidine kinase
MALRPLDRLRSIKMKLGVLVVATTTFAALATWLGLQVHLGPTRTFPLVVLASLVLIQVLARGMTSPLREMTAAARAMADGHYDQRVTATSRDEVGTLATTFNQMAADLASADQSRRDLIANVSHELRTPIAALQAQLENLVDGVTEPTATALESALAQTERLTRLVSYLLDLSRVEAGASALTITTIPVGDFLEECSTELSMVEAAKDLHYVIDAPPDLVLDADSERLQQIVVNLLQNAIRHSPSGGEIRLHAYPLGTDVVIDISDDGPGIAPKDRQRVFERFTRGTATASGGTGIGLAIVRWAVDLHGGRICVADSPAGSGATMRLAFPAHRTPAPDPRVSPSAPDSDAGPE